MNIKEIGDVFHCDCGFSWSRGKNGNHNCANGLREKVRQLAAENVGLKAAINAVNRTAEECEVNGDELKYVVEPSEFEALIDFMDETPATDRIVAGIKADGLPANIAEIIDSGDLETICYESERSYAEDFRLALYNFRQLREGADK
ncbi:MULTISPECIES: hypothetical protein [Klebsiella/Raoultella group]|uniref:hypothetical protein n=1 Tax=Klebsiella/Raoultella group TaxID=2890311 RepID=UPI00065A50D7|nr:MULTISPECIES: hypothetical protein [Klebsiella/Raoultella group]KMI13232.1 hypothetical protein SM85_03255 [Klebsiella variicola]WPO25477.1 hypothetical protein SH582_06025 [Raoultella ornithinolytica]